VRVTTDEALWRPSSLPFTTRQLFFLTRGQRIYRAVVDCCAVCKFDRANGQVSGPSPHSLAR
jgi:hypothetical protein